MDPRVETPPHQRPGCLSGCLAILIILFPIFGDVVCTVFVATDDLTLVEKILWIAAFWLITAIVPIGWFVRALYLLVGQRRNRLLSA